MCPCPSECVHITINVILCGSNGFNFHKSDYAYSTVDVSPISQNVDKLIIHKFIMLVVV